MRFTNINLSAIGLGLAALATTSSADLTGDVVHQLASIYEFPYQVSVNYQNLPICSGAILSPDWVITAGGCVYQNEVVNTSVRVGSSSNTLLGFIHDVSEIRPHYLFNPNTGRYDIALLKLTTPLTMGPGVGAVKLVAAKTPLPAEGTQATAAGWNYYDSHLQVNPVTVFNRDDCAQIFASKHALVNTDFCAGFFDSQKGRCQRDRGAPLVDVETNKLIGLATSLNDCVPSDQPGLYTDISSARQFIRLVAGL